MSDVGVVEWLWWHVGPNLTLQLTFPDAPRTPEQRQRLRRVRCDPRWAVALQVYASFFVHHKGGGGWRAQGETPTPCCRPLRDILYCFKEGTSSGLYHLALLPRATATEPEKLLSHYKRERHCAGLGHAPRRQQCHATAASRCIASLVSVRTAEPYSTCTLCGRRVDLTRILLSVLR
ncbi:hypothetical protein LY78DRAFT_381843 [Colletotrichum sublineola]|nr:hypothetical protein LY78DRAFT_381843 [Colletotrichum sublineola]